MPRQKQLKKNSKKIQKFIKTHLRSKYIVPGVFIVFGLATMSLFSYAIMAKAEVSKYYPSNCLGNWVGAQRAAGTPETAFENVDTDANESNSAIYDGGAKQIYCGMFQGSLPDASQINNVKLKLFWSIKPKQVISNSSINDALTTTPTEAEPVLTVTSSPDSTTTSSPEIPATTQTSTSGQPNQTIDDPQPSTTPAEPPAPANPAPETTPPSPVSEPSTDKILDFLFSAANAEEFTNPTSQTDLNDIFIVKYSFDGVTWQNLGQINPTEFQKVFNVPVSSADDLTHLQISIESGLNLNDNYVVYLDGMEIGAEYLTSPLQNALEEAQKIIDEQPIVDQPVATTTPEVAEDTATTTIQPAVLGVKIAKPAPQIVRKTLLLLQNIGLIPAKTDLPWYQSDMAAKFKKDSVASGKITATVDSANENFHITGPCPAAYFTILIFKDKNDYINNPASAIFNQAHPCTAKDFTFDLPSSQLPGIVDDSKNYYLLVAAQDDNTPWWPVAPLQPVSFKTVTDTVQ